MDESARPIPPGMYRCRECGRGGPGSEMKRRPDGAVVHRNHPKPVHGLRCFVWRCSGHGLHAPALFGGWEWRR